MDQHLKKMGRCTLRVLETVWYVQYSGDQRALYDYVDSIRVLIISAEECMMRNLLVPAESLQNCWT